MEKLDIKNWSINIKNWQIWEKLGLCTLIQSRNAKEPSKQDKEYTAIEWIDMCIELLKNRKEHKKKIKLRCGPEMPGFERNDKYGYGDYICTSAWGRRLFWIAPDMQLVINMDGGPNEHNKGYELAVGRAWLIVACAHEGYSDEEAVQTVQKLKELYKLCEKTWREMEAEESNKYWARRAKWDRLLDQISFNATVQRFRRHMQK